MYPAPWFVALLVLLAVVTGMIWLMEMLAQT